MRRLTVAFLVLAFGLAACSSEPVPDRAVKASPPPAVMPSTSASSQPFADAEASAPAVRNCTFTGTRLNIPSIGVKAVVKRLKLNRKGELDPPPGIVGWDVRTPWPGRPGVAVLAGHVRYNTPDVFANLHKIKQGSDIAVRQCKRGLLSEAKFVATSSETMPKQKLMRSNRVWNLDGSITTPELRLITCENAPGFPNNFLVYGERV